MDQESLITRCHKLILICLEGLEGQLEKLTINGAVSATGFPEWDRLFGAKETVISVLAKLVALQKTVGELEGRMQAEQKAGESMPMTQQDWELLALCVQRWQERSHGLVDDRKS